MKKVQMATKASKPSKAEKGALTVKLLKSLVGDDDGNAEITARVDLTLHAYTWVQVATAANAHGWEVNDVISDIIDRHIENLDRDLNEEKRRNEEYGAKSKAIQATLTARSVGLEAQ